MPAPRKIRNRSKAFDKNIDKRGNVPLGKFIPPEEEEKKKPPMGLIIMFCFLVFGSALVPLLRLFFAAPAIPKSE